MAEHEEHCHTHGPNSEEGRERSGLHEAAFGESPLFQARTSEAVKLFLSSNIRGLRLVREHDKDRIKIDQPLLHHCCSVITKCPFKFKREGCAYGGDCKSHDHVRSDLVVALKDQLDLEWGTLTPLDLAIEKGTNALTVFRVALRLHSEGEIPAVDNSNQQECPRSIIRLFSGSTKEWLRVTVFTKATDNYRIGTTFLNKFRAKVARAICVGGHAFLFRVANSRLGFTAEDLSRHRDEQYSCLWLTSDVQNASIVGQILDMEGVSGDVVERDGTTAFAIALGHQNAEIVEQFLTSGSLGEESKMLAVDILNEDDVDEKTPALKSSIRRSLNLDTINDREQLGRQQTVSKRVLLTRRYPLFNGDAERACPIVAAIDREMDLIIGTFEE